MKIKDILDVVIILTILGALLFIFAWSVNNLLSTADKKIQEYIGEAKDTGVVIETVYVETNECPGPHFIRIPDPEFEALEPREFWEAENEKADTVLRRILDSVNTKPKSLEKL